MFLSDSDGVDDGADHVLNELCVGRLPLCGAFNFFRRILSFISLQIRTIMSFVRLEL